MFDSVLTSNVTINGLKKLIKDCDVKYRQEEANLVKKEDELFKTFESPLRGFRVYTDDYLCPTAEIWTGKWLVEGNEYFQYWDGKGQPSSWAIYCGFVKKEMKKTKSLYMFDARRMAILNACF